MGTSGSYSGSGGKVGDGLREGMGDWIDSLPAGLPAGPGQNTPSDEGQDSAPQLEPTAVLPVVSLLRPRSSGGAGGDGPGGSGAGGGEAGSGGGRGGGGPRRSVGRSATTAGRAAAAAYAYRSGDAPTLERLGLNLAELSTVGDQYEIARRIVEAACGARADSTIDDYEQRLVAADVAEWVLSQEADGGPPMPEEIVRHTIALIIADAFLSETGEQVNNSNHADRAESEVRDAAEALAGRPALSVTGVTEAEFTQAIEDGIEALRAIYEESS
jgi:hypothetical protein